MKDYYKNKESSYLQYLDLNNLNSWAMSPKLPVNQLEWIKDTFQFNKDFKKDYNEEGDEGYFLAVDVKYPEKTHEIHNELPFLTETIILEKVECILTNIYDKTNNVIRIRNLKQTLNPEISLKKVHIVVKCNQKAWLKPYIDMNTKLKR